MALPYLLVDRVSILGTLETAATLLEGRRSGDEGFWVVVGLSQEKGIGERPTVPPDRTKGSANRES